MTFQLDQTFHIKSWIDKEDLKSLITSLEVCCDGNLIEIIEAYDLVVKDKRQFLALEAIFGSNKIDSEVQQIKVPVPVQKIRKETRAWRILDSIGMVTEQITIEEKNRRLATGEFKPDTILHHPRSGRQRVIGQIGFPQRLEQS